jgi:hypothetical protein
MHWGRTKSKNKKINAITKDHDCIIQGVEHEKIKFIHNCKKIGGTRINPNIIVAGFIGLRAKALPIIIDPDNSTEDLCMQRCQQTKRPKQFNWGKNPPSPLQGNQDQEPTRTIQATNDTETLVEAPTEMREKSVSPNCYSPPFSGHHSPQEHFQ